MSETNEMSKSELWFEENVKEDGKELLKIAELANDELSKKICLSLEKPTTVLAIYATIFNTIVDEIVSMEDEYDTFCLNLADTLAIGYTNTDSEDDEKMGNFMVFMQHMASTVAEDDDEENETNNTIELSAQWNAANIKTQANIINAIAAKAKKRLSTFLNLKTESVEFIIPMFCIIHGAIVKYMLVNKKTTEEECEINVAGLYTVGVRETDDAELEIYYIPSIALKLAFKSDAKATGTKE